MSEPSPINWEERAAKLKKNLEEKKAQHPIKTLEQHYQQKIPALRNELDILSQKQQALLSSIRSIESENQKIINQIQFRAAMDIADLEPKGLISKMVESFKRLFGKTEIGLAQEKVSQQASNNINTIKKDERSEITGIERQLNQLGSASKNIKAQIRELEKTLNQGTSKQIAVPIIPVMARPLVQQAYDTASHNVELQQRAQAKMP